MYNLISRDRSEDFIGELFSPLFTTDMHPAVDCIEEESCYKVLVNVPGIAKENIELDFKPSTLLIKVTTKKDITEKAVKYLVRERRAENWSRSIVFNKNVDQDSIQASLKEGVLTIQINKLEAVQKKRIAIN